MIPEKQRIKHDIGLRHVGVLVISPSQDIGKLAEEYTHELPRSIRFLLRGIGGTKRSNSNLVSYLLFEKAYCRRLIDLGFHDADAPVFGGKAQAKTQAFEPVCRGVETLPILFFLIN